MHDARIFNISRLCAQFERGDIQGMLLGDNGYPCRPYLMTPLADPQTAPVIPNSYEKYSREDVRGLEKVIPLSLHVYSNKTFYYPYNYYGNSRLVQFR